MRPSHISPGGKQLFTDSNQSNLQTLNLRRTKSLQELINSRANFSDLLSELPAYKFSLAKIQKNYDTGIIHQQKVLQMNHFEQELDEISLNQIQTLQFIKERELSIDSKLKLYRATSRDIMGKITRKKQEKLEIEKRRTLESLAVRNRLSLTMSRRKVILPSLINEDIVFDIDKLTEATNRRKKEIDTLLANRNTLYKPASAKEKFISDLLEREQLKTDVIEENSRLSAKINNCSIALQLIQTSRNLEHAPDETYTHLIQGILHHSSTTDESTAEFDDSTVEKETELKLSYFETFNDLFAAGKYLEAAIQASSSPKGFLRTYEIIQRFSQVTTPPGQEPVLMIFCEVLLDTVSAFGPLAPDVSIGCVNIMVKLGKFDLISHSVFQGLLTFSNELGSLLYSLSMIDMKYLSLAIHVFTGVNNRAMVASCLYAMDRPIAMFNYFREFQDDDFVLFLCHEPSFEKATLMLKPVNDYPPVIDLPNLLLLYIRSGIAILSVQIFFSFFAESNPHSFGNQLLYDFTADVGIWEEIAVALYNVGFTDIGERIFVSILSRHVIYTANNNFRHLLDYH